MEVSLGSDTHKSYILPLSMRELGHALERMALSMGAWETGDSEPLGAADSPEILNSRSMDSASKDIGKTPGSTSVAGALPLQSLELSLLDDAAIAELNRDFLGVEGPTNVLSFPGQGGVGSLALSVETIRREAWLYGQDATGYTLKMLAHGLAHLMGYDHGPDMDKLVDKGLAAVADIMEEAVK